MVAEFLKWYKSLAPTARTLEAMKAKAEQLGLDFWTILEDGIMIASSIETIATNPSFKGVNSIAVQVTNEANPANTITIPTPATVTF
jgi:hydroxymethylpyrimidine pyrophosphatase-like HAD family hydrolase